jgi:hypothetical protein
MQTLKHRRARARLRARWVKAQVKDESRKVDALKHIDAEIARRQNSPPLRSSLPKKKQRAAGFLEAVNSGEVIPNRQEAA